MDSVQAWHDGGKRHLHHCASLGPLPLFYRRDGQGAGLLCIHGFPTASWDFRPLWPKLTARFDTIAPDLIGMGYSAKPDRPLGVDLQADAFEGLMVDAGFEQAHLLAHDLGDTVAQELLARQIDGSSRVRWLSCTFLNGGLFPESHQPLLIQHLLASPVGPLVARLTSEARFRTSLRRVFGPDTPPSDAFLDDAWMLLTRDGGRRMLPRLIRYMGERRRRRDRWVGALLQATIPLRLIDGALDPISGRHLAERYADQLPNADVVMLDHVGHYPHVEDPPAVLKAFLEFVEPHLAG